MLIHKTYNLKTIFTLGKASFRSYPFLSLESLNNVLISLAINPLLSSMFSTVNTSFFVRDDGSGAYFCIRVRLGPLYDYVLLVARSNFAVAL